MRRRAFLGVVGTTAVAGCMGDDSGSNGEQSDGQQRDNRSADEEGSSEVVQRSFNAEWQVSLDTNVAYAANMDTATADGRLYLGGGWGLTAVKVTEGEKLWTRADWTQYVEVEATEAVVGAVTRDGEMLSLDPDGSLNWVQEVPGDTLRPEIAVVGGRIALTNRYGVRVYDAESGTELWRVSGAGGVYTTPETLVAARAFDPTTGHDLSTGDQQWETDANMRLGGAVVPEEDLVVAVDGLSRRTVNALDTGSGDLRWSVDDIEATLFARIGVGEGIAVLIDQSGAEKTLVAISLSEGSVAWEQSLGNPSELLQPLVGAGAVITKTEAGIAAFDPDSGRQYDVVDEEVIVGAIEAGHFLSCETEVVGYTLQPTETAE